MKKLLFSGLMCLLGVSLFAQEVEVSLHGFVVDGSDNSPLVGATVLCINVKDSTRSKAAVADLKGEFKVGNLEKAFYKIRVQSLGYKTFTRILRIGDADMEIGTISLVPDEKILDEAKVEGEVIAVVQNGDTTQYNAAAFKVNPDASAKDLVSKMPGIEVDASGVRANGESIQQVLLDGKRFFGQDPLLSLNNIPAEVVDKVEVFDQLSEQARFTGFNDGNTTKTMNVVTKEDKRKGQFGRVYAGYGTDDLYSAGGNINSFNNDQRITIIGMSNNTNQQNFANEDLAGVSGGQRRGFRGGGGGNLFTANQDGITTTNSVGVNFTDDWGKKASFEGSYFFNDTDNTNNQVTGRETFSDLGNQFYDETQESSAQNLNHRLNMRMTFDLTEKSQIVLLPNLSFQDNQSLDQTIGLTTTSAGDILRETRNNYNSENQAYRLENRLIFQRKLNKTGRTISFDFNSLINNRNRDNLLFESLTNSSTDFQTDEKQTTLGGAITYNEPIGLSGQLSVSYDFSFGKRDSDRATFEFAENESPVLNTSLSNKFSSEEIIHLPSVAYSIRGMGRFFRASLSYQQVGLNNQQEFPQQGNYNNTFHAILPMMMGRLEFGKGWNMFYRYSTETNTPSVSQLQNVVDNGNPLFWSTGNPELKQSYSHNLIMRMRSATNDDNLSFSNFTRAQVSRNFITDETFLVTSDTTLADNLTAGAGVQLSQPINMNGYVSINNNSTLSFPLEKLKSKLNLSLGFGFTRTPGRINQEENYARTYNSNTRLAFVSNISEKADFNISYQFAYNSVENTLQNVSESNYLTHTIAGNMNFLFGKGFVFRSSVTYLGYRGVNDSFDTDFTLWNLEFGKKFLKNQQAELSITVYDLLKQNQSISQTVSAAFIQETRTEVLQQYFMLNFAYKFSRFGGK